MEFNIPISITVESLSVVPENPLEARKYVYIPRCLITIGNFVSSILFCSVFLVLPMIEIIIGIVYINDCSMNSYIPIYLIFAGLISFIHSIFAIFGWIFLWPFIENFKFKTLKSLFSNARLTSKILSIIALIFLLFGLAWFITGNIWIYTSRSKVQYTNPFDSSTYCNRTVYLTGFWSIIVKYILIWILSCQLNCYMCLDIQKTLDQNNSKQT